MDSKNAALYITVAAEVFHSQSQFLPGIEQLRKDTYAKHYKTVRMGQVYSGVWTFLIALAVAYITDSPIPLAIWLAGTGIMFVLYEYQMKSPAEIGYGESD